MEPSDSPIAQPPDYSTYHHVRTLGRGASGTVVLAQEPNSGHLVCRLFIDFISLLILCICLTFICSNSLPLDLLFLRAWRVRDFGSTTHRPVLAFRSHPNSFHFRCLYTLLCCLYFGPVPPECFQVALKRIETPSRWPWRPRRHAESEFALTRDLNHPNIVKALDLFFDTPTGSIGDPIPVIALTLVTGMSLINYLIDYPGLNQAQVKTLARQMIFALQYLHDQLIVHRDISCDNIMITPMASPGGALHAVLIDFGLAKCVTHKGERLTDLVGEGYMYAPEMLAGMRPADVGRSTRDADSDTSSLEAETDPNGHWNGYLGTPIDVWGLGCVLWTVQCRKLPFGGSTFPELLHAIRRKQPEMTLLTRLKLSGDCKAALRGMLEKDPTRRWSVEKLRTCAWLRCELLSSVGNVQHSA